jgi:hypothetical protein
MPAKGRYFLNEGDEGPDQAALYEKYRLTSLHGPLLLLLLLVAAATCIALISIAFSHEVRPKAVAPSLPTLMGKLRHVDACREQHLLPL